MAGKKNQVVLTFAAESKNLEGAIDRLDAGAKKTEQGFDRMGAGAEGAETDLAKLGDRSRKTEDDLGKLGDRSRKTQGDLDGFGGQVRGLDKVLGSGGRTFGDYGKGLGGVGDRFDEVDTRAMGVADGFAGLTDAMKWNQLTAQEQAMVFSDLGSSMYNAVIPSLQSGAKAIKGFVGDLGGIKSVLLGGGALAAMGALGFVLHDAAEEARDAHFDDVAEDLVKTGDAAQAAADALGDPGPDFTHMFSGASSDVGNLHAALSRLVEGGNFDEANDLIQKAGERGDITAGEMEALSKMVDGVAESSEGAAASQGLLADSIRGTSDAIAAQTDPVFAMIDADNQLRDANQAVADAHDAINDAVKEFGEGSPEHLEALRALNDAEVGVAGAVYGNEAAMRELAASMVDGGGDVAAMTAHLRSLEDQGIIAKGTTDAFAEAVRDIPRRSDTTISAHDFATNVINAVGDRARVVDGTIVDIMLQASWVGGGSAYAAFTGRTRASGGIVEYMAAGGISRGPRGTDTVPTWLTPGEMVFNKGQQAQLWDMVNGRGGRGGGGGVTVIVQGSVFDGGREIARHVREELQRGGFAGLVGAR